GMGDAVAGEGKVFNKVERRAVGGQGLEVQRGAGEDGGAGLDRVGAADQTAQRVVVLDGHPALLNGGGANIGVGIGQDEVAGADLGEGGVASEVADIAGDGQAVVAGEVGVVGTGHLILPNANTYIGATSIEQGWVTIQNNNSLGSLIGGPDTVQPGTTVLAGAALHLKPLTPTSAPFNLIENLTLSGNGITHP